MATFNPMVENMKGSTGFPIFLLVTDPLRSSARYARALLGEMTGGIAHDFRNILAVIGSSLRFAEKHSGKPEKVSYSIAAARDGIERGLKLTSQFLAFAKQRELTTHAGDANEYLKTLELFLEFSAGSSIHIVLALASDIPSAS
jgi:signal transduction histidine kinase